MEDDDDEFGDLYSDVLRPLTSFSASQPPPIQSTPPNLSRPIDINIESDHERITSGAPNSKFTFNFSSSSPNYDLVSDSEKTAPKLVLSGISDSHRNLNVDDKLENKELDKKEDLAGVGNNWASDSIRFNSRVLESGGDVKLQKRAIEDPNYVDESGIDIVVDEGDDKDGFWVEKEENLAGKRENFDAKEVDTGIGDLGSAQMIPGLSIPGVSDAVDYQSDVHFATRDDATGEGDDWDSDSEDDLQIVLNDNNHGPMAMDGTGVIGTDDEDEDGDPLVIVADSDPNHQLINEQEWGEDAAQGTDGERKELGDAAKVNVVVVAPKIGYSNHGYHPFHSQFKYVRPGAEPMPGSSPAGPGGAPGQVRPPVNMGPIAGRGRGDWRPIGRSASSLQKNFHQGFGMPVWGNNTSGRGSGSGSGLEFTLPSHKTILDVEIDSFEEKQWRLPGIEMSDFFNFGLNEESWKDYCKQLAQLRLEATMQSKIRVYESGRREQEYDPDLPPELAAAAGFRDVPFENINIGRTDAGQSDLAKGSAHVRPTLPTGRAIQVESGYGERLPSIDTRPPRIRDSDAIIEIVLQDSMDDNSFPENDVADRPENDPAREDAGGDHVIVQCLPHIYNGRKGELVGQRAPFMNSVCDNMIGTVPLHPEAPSQCHLDSEVDPGRNLGIPHEKRWSKGRANDKSPNMTPSEETQDKSMFDNQKEGSVESIGGKHSPLLSPISDGTAGELGVEHGDGMHDELVLADGTSTMEKEEIALIKATNTLKDENSMHSVKKQNLSSRIEQPYLQGIDDGEDLKAARSSENSKARSGSSRDYQQLRDAVEEEVVQDGHSTHMLNIKRALAEDEQHVRRKGRGERHEIERHRMVVEVRDDSYSHRDRDPILAHKLHAKTDGIDRQNERDNSDGAWQWRDDDPYGRQTKTEDLRKRERGDEMGSRHQTKVRESERAERDERLQLRKQLDNSSWRGHHDKDMGSRYRERDDNLRSRYEKMSDLHGKRREEEKYLRRDHAEKGEILHGHSENTTHRKRKRDDVMDQWKRDDHARIMDDDHRSVRHKEEGWFQRERDEKQRDRDEKQRDRDEWHMPKQLNEVSSSKRERDGGQGGIRSGRATEDKVWVSSHGRVKDENKGSDRDSQFKDTGKQSEQLKRRDRVENRSSQHRGHEDVYARGKQLSNDERRSRPEKTSTHNDRVSSASDNHRAYQKENAKKSKESEGGDHNSFGPSKRNLEDHSGQISDTVICKGTSEQGNHKNEIPVNHHFSRKHREDASSDDEHQDSRRGRSKLERWTCHKERDTSISATSSSSLKVKEIDRYNDAGSSLASKLPDRSSKMVESIDNQHPFSDGKDVGNPEIRNVNVKRMEDKQLNTVEKLKKRSERFKLPMPSEKDALAIKKMESEQLPPAQSDTHADSDIKQERPARKRRWVSN